MTPATIAKLPREDHPWSDWLCQRLSGVRQVIDELVELGYSSTTLVRMITVLVVAVVVLLAATQRV